MRYSLNVENSSCSCSEISKGLIHVITKDTFEEYAIKIDSKENEYFTLNLLDTENKTLEDFKTLMLYYNFNLCTSMMNKSSFDKYIRSICLK